MDIAQQAVIYFYIFAFVYLGLSLYASVYFLRGRLHVEQRNRSKGVKIVFALLLCMSVFYANGDYWTYKNWYETESDWQHIEESWRIVRGIVPYGYGWFRTVVWGVGLLLYYLILRKTNVDRFSCILLFSFLFAEKYCYARASLAFMCVLYAFVLLVSNKQNNKLKILDIIISAFLLVVGVSLHRSMPILCICLLLSLLLGYNRQRYKLVFLLLPLFIVVFNTLVFPSVFDYLTGNEDFEHLVEVNILNDTRGFHDLLVKLISFAPMLLAFFVAYGKSRKLSSPVTDGISIRIANAAFTIVIIAIMFLFIDVGNGLTLFYRTIIMAYPFMIITVSDAITKNHINKYFLIAIFLLQWYNIYEFLFYIIIHPEYLQNQILERFYYGL